MQISKNLNYPLIFNFIFLVLIGFVIQYSVGGGSFSPFLLHQICILFFVGFPVAFIILKLETDFYNKSAYYFFTIATILLLVVHLIGKTSMGATRWINFMGINFQPTEMFKIALIFMLAKYFSKLKASDLDNLIFLSLPLLIIIFPLYLILKQPSLGACIIILLISFSMYFAAGVKLKYFLGLIVIIAFLTPLSWQYGLHDYQRVRILTFLDNSDANDKGSGYNIIQSKIAIGSGGLFGKGFLHGSQAQLRFLPEKHTDFALSVFAEEFGFFGIMIVVMLYIAFCIQGIIIGIKTYDIFLKLIAIGISLLFFYHFAINTAMISGLIPVVGMPLLIFSYGGSITLASVVGFMLLLKIDLEKKISDVYL